MPLIASWMQTVRRSLMFVAPTSSALTACCLAFIATAAAAPIMPQQLTVTVANAAGDSIYDLSLATGSGGALISGVQALNTDGTKHGSFDALVWSPNAFTGTLDLIVADAARAQILRYAGPNYGTSSVIFTYTSKGSGPAYPAGVAVDGSGNLFVISSISPLNSTPSLWVVPFYKATGSWGAPILIDQSFGGVRTLALADVLVAGTPATTDGSAAPAWNAGDVLVLVGDTFDSRVIVYSKAAVSGVLAKPTVPVTGPTATIVTSKQFLSLIAAPFGMDIWPADATHGVSLLFTTIDGRIIRFDTRQNAFTSSFASGLGPGVTKLKVGAYAGKPYAFVAQLGPSSSGQILQFGAPPASGSNKALAIVSKGVNEPIGLALTGSGSVAASSCTAPSSCSPLGPQLTVQISGPGASKIPVGATILQQACTVPADPRVAVVNGVWSCLGPTINVCGTTPTPGCVPTTLDVANYCPGFPSTILPATMCGHAGANGAAFQVVKGTAVLLDENANDIYIQTSTDPTVVLPGAYDLNCQQGIGQYGPLLAFAPRSDLPTIEGTIVEDSAAPFFTDVSGYCDEGGGDTHVESMFAFGLGLNANASGLGSGPNGGLYGFITTKFNNLTTTLQQAAPQITPGTVTTTLENYVTQSQNYFNSDYNHDVNDYSCALNSIASADIYLRNQARGTAFTYTAPAAGNNNPNPAGEIDSRLANLYLSISGDFLFTPNPTWPTTNVPPCVTLSITAANNSLAVGGSGTLIYGPPAPQFATTPLLSVPTQCTLSASDGTYATPAMVMTSGSVSTGTLTKAGTYTATLECAGAATDTSSSFATASVPVSSTPTLTSITVAPTPPAAGSVPDGRTQQFTATGHYSSGAASTLPAVVWSTSNGVASVNAAGLATCLTVGTSSISATSGNVKGSATLTCASAVLTSITASPNPASVAAGTTQQFTASGTNSLNQTVTPTVAWTSSNLTVATITGAGGLASCLTMGTSTIAATASGITGKATLNCTAALLGSLAVTPTTASGFVGGTVQFADTAKDAFGNPTSPGPVTWTSGSTAVASISSTGLATCLSMGPSTITAASGAITSNQALLTCNSATLTLSASPTTTMINGSVTLTWSSNLPASELCALTSNSSDAPLNVPAQPPHGTLNTTDAVAQSVTYTINCTGQVSASAQVQVLYTLTTTYQYTGNQFPAGDAYEQYSDADRVIASITVSVPFAPNLSSVDVTGVPGFVLTMSDGQQTLGPQSGASSHVFVSTDSNGNISSWSMTNSTGSGNQVSTQGDPTNAESVDDGYQGTGINCESPTDCGSIARNEGSWTSTNAQSLHVIFGTTAGSNPTTGQLYQAIVGGTAAAPTLSVPTILSETPEPAACYGDFGDGGPSGASGIAAAITGLALVPNATSGYSDLVASNGIAGDVFLLSGPSYQPTSDINSASPNCWATGPSDVSVAADAAGDVVGAGHDINHYLPSLYYFPPGASGTVPNFVLMDYVNDDPSLTSCGSDDGAPTENSGCVYNLADAVVSPNAVTGAGVGAGDLLVLVGDEYAGNGNPVVLRYPAAAIQTAKAYATNCSASFGNTSGTPSPCVANSGGSQLVTQSVMGAPNQQSTLTLQSGESPVSMDVSPIDGSLFIATSSGNIYQLAPNSTGYSSSLFAAGLSGIQQVRVGQLAGVLYVFATLQTEAANSLVAYVGPAPTGGFGTSGAGVASIALPSGNTPGGLSVH